MCLNTRNPIGQLTQNWVVRAQPNSTHGCKIILAFALSERHFAVIQWITH